MPLVKGHRSDPLMATTVQRVSQLRRWRQEDHQISRVVERAWFLAMNSARPKPGAVRGPVGLVLQEAESLGWDWSSPPWQFRRKGQSPVPLCGGPNGYFSHELREDTRQREYGKALKRRPGLQGVEHIDRRAVYKALSVKGPRAKRVTPRQRGCVQAVVTGAVTLQRHLAAAGLVESAACPFCDTGEEETEEHAFWRCPAWKHIRAK